MANGLTTLSTMPYAPIKSKKATITAVKALMDCGFVRVKNSPQLDPGLITS